MIIFDLAIHKVSVLELVKWFPLNFLPENINTWVNININNWIEEPAFNFKISVSPAKNKIVYTKMDFYEKVNKTWCFQISNDTILKTNKDIELDLNCGLNPDLYQAIQSLVSQVPVKRKENQDSLKQWGKSNSEDWTEKFRAVMIKHRNIGYDWQFNDNQKELLRQYYDANQLLVDCLNSDCYISREVRQEIEDTLLLPMAEIEKRQG